jgi:hypothetical protein
MTSNWKVLNTKFVQLLKIYNCCFGQLSIWDSLDGSNLWFLNFNVYKLVFGTLDCLKLKSFEYQVCSAHQDLQSLYRPFFHLRKFEKYPDNIRFNNPDISDTYPDYPISAGYRWYYIRIWYPPKISVLLSVSEKNYGYPSNYPDKCSYLFGRTDGRINIRTVFIHRCKEGVV